MSTAELLAIAGVLVLLLDLAVLGGATFFLVFLGLSLICSALLLWLGLIEDTATHILIANAILTPVFAVLLWQPMKKFQARSHDAQPHHDFEDLLFTLDDEVTVDGKVQYRYSGVDWALKSKSPIAAGTQVKVVRAEVGVFWVEPSDSE